MSHVGARRAPSGVTVEVSPGVGAAFRKAMKGVDYDAVDQLLDHFDRDPRALRRYGGLNIRHAPSVLRALASPSSTRRPVARSRTVRRRQATRATRGSPRLASEPPLPEPALAASVEEAVGRCREVAAATGFDFIGDAVLAELERLAEAT
jgi:hypothetical protein